MTDKTALKEEIEKNLLGKFCQTLLNYDEKGDTKLKFKKGEIIKVGI